MTHQRDEITHDVLAYIGRFQPFTRAHAENVRIALKRAKRVAIIIGSDQRPRDPRNPWTTSERIAMIANVFPDEVSQGRIVFCPQVDHMYNLDRWIGGVQSSVTSVAYKTFTPDPVKVGLIGHAKDKSSFYLKSFPQWSKNSINVDNFEGIDATTVRELIFSGDEDYEALIPPEVVTWMKTSTPEELADVRKEHEFIENYKRGFTQPTDAELYAMAGSNKATLAALWQFRDRYTTPYHPVFYCADAVVRQSGHVLLVRRGAMPGKGLLALPGGFVDRYEVAVDAAVRELHEETQLDVPVNVLRRCISKTQLFEDPHRSLRGRTLTVAHLFDLRSDTKLPKVKGGDDAADAMWVPVSDLKRNNMYDDHYDILEVMLGL